jgi:GMP reductase
MLTRSIRQTSHLLQSGACFSTAGKPLTGPARAGITLHRGMKHNFSDVLIVPQKSFVPSRSQVNIETTYRFKHSPHAWTGVPIMSSNMDTVTNVQTAELLATRSWLSVFPKHFNAQWGSGKELPAFLAQTDRYVLSCGISDRDVDSVVGVIEQIRSQLGAEVKLLCVDVANGYLDNLV